MARSGFLLIFVALVAVTFQQALALKCWECTSTAPFCDDPFDDSGVSESEKSWSYNECNPVQSFDQKAVCKKIIQQVNDVPIITRSCSWENVYAPENECYNSNTPSYVKIDFCETCDSDGCNGAAQYGPTALITAIAAIAAKILLL